MIVLDGSAGEGGGQILRTALGLAVALGRPFRLEGIRAGRPKPGLRLQHLACVEAAGRVGGARVEGAHLGSSRLLFEPSGVFPGVYEFSIGSAGSAVLVLHTLLPALLTASTASRIIVEGGTHNPLAPSFDHCAEVLLPILRRMGPGLDFTLVRHGFHPAGKGRLELDIRPTSQLRSFQLETRGERRSRWARARVARLPTSIAERELAVIRRQLGWPASAFELIEVLDSAGPGNVVEIGAEHEHGSELIVEFGERGRPAERVAEAAVAAFRDWDAGGAPVGHHLADQLLIPMALAGGGSFVCRDLSSHARTNMATVECFLPGRFVVESVELGSRVTWR